MPISPANSVTSSKPTWYVYDQFSFDPVAEMPAYRQAGGTKEIQLRRAEGRLLSSEIFSPDAPEPGDELQELGRYAYYYSDHRGDITSVLKHDGQSLHSYVYEEYGSFYDVNQGKVDSSNFIDPHNAYTFSGKEFDRETGLMYYGARFLDPWSGTWNTQDVLRGSIHFPETMHRYAFVKNNPANYGDPDGMLFKQYGPLGEYADKYLENKIIDPYLESYSAAHTYDAKVSTPQIPLIPQVSVNVSQEVDLDFNFTDDGYTFKSTQTASGGVITQNNAYKGSVTADAGVVAKDQELYTAKGGAVTIQKNGQVIVEGASFKGDEEVLPLFGATSAQDYKNKRLAFVNQKANEALQKASEERTQRELALQKKMEAWKLEAQRQQLAELNATSDLLTKLKKNGGMMSDEYTKDLLQYYKAFQFADETPWYFPTNKAGAYLAAGMIYDKERASTYLVFFNHVKPLPWGGDWDYKTEDSKRFEATESVPLAGVNDDRIKYDAMGNINFGYTGAAAGIPDEILKSGAGVAQIAVGTSKAKWYSSYFDDPNDQIMINVGIDLYKHYGTNIDEQKLKKALDWELGNQFYMTPGSNYWDTN